MTITTNSYVDQTVVTDIGVVHFRVATDVLRDGVSIGNTYERFTLVPGSDLTGVPDSVKAICEVVWTPEVIAEYQKPREPTIP